MLRGDTTRRERRAELWLYAIGLIVAALVWFYMGWKGLV